MVKIKEITCKGRYIIRGKKNKCQKRRAFSKKNCKKKKIEKKRQEKGRNFSERKTKMYKK